MTDTEREVRAVAERAKDAAADLAPLSPVSYTHLTLPTTPYV